MAEHASPFVWSVSGQMLAPIIWVGTTTTSGGTWSLDYTAAGFISAPYVTATAVLSAANVYDRAFASLSGPPTTTGVSGYAVRGANMLILGSSVRTVPDGTVIHVIAIGDTFA
ncbi:hypothetical protein D3C80_345340 [compost metagenome]